MRLSKSRRKFRIVLKSPPPCSYLVLDGGNSNPLTQILMRVSIPHHNYQVSEFNLYFSRRYLVGLLKFTARYGFSVGRLLAHLEAFEVRGVITLEKSDQRNALRAVSYELPTVQIISVQHSRFFESVHPHNTWGNPLNVRLITWGEYHADLAEMQGRDRSLMIPMGSVNLAMHREVARPKTRDIPILVSLKAKGIGVPGSSQIETEKVARAGSTIQLLKMLGLYARARGIALAFPHDPREDPGIAEDYLKAFKAISGVECFYVTPSHLARSGSTEILPSVFSAIRSARVFIGVNSSLLWEAIADSQPTLSVSFGNVLYNQFPCTGPWVLRNPTQHEFESAVDAAMNLELDELSRRSEQFSKYLISASRFCAATELGRFLTASHMVETLDQADKLWRATSRVESDTS